MNLNPGQLPTYKSLFPVLRTQTTCFVLTGRHGVSIRINQIITKTLNRHGRLGLVNENYKYDPELLNLKGKVWLLFSHVYPLRNEEKYMMELLLSKGSEVLDVKKYKGSSVYYVDTKKPKPYK